MTYAEEAERLTPAKAEILLRALDALADVDPGARPGHVAYRSKQDMRDTASLALSAVRTPIKYKE